MILHAVQWLQHELPDCPLSETGSGALRAVSDCNLYKEKKYLYQLNPYELLASAGESLSLYITTSGVIISLYSFKIASMLRHCNTNWHAQSLICQIANASGYPTL